MKARPILFKGEMVNAILDGRKTQTRRMVKEDHRIDNKPNYKGHRPKETHLWAWNIFTDNLESPPICCKCPYGKVGDQLYVRETFNSDWCDGILYKADCPSPTAAREAGYSKEPKWTPSIHMNRKYSRIQLEITDIRVERLNDISEEDAWAEGCLGYDDDVTGGQSGYSEFLELWESINGKDSWNENPWVWCVSFKVLDKEGL